MCGIQWEYYSLSLPLKLQEIKQKTEYNQSPLEAHTCKKKTILLCHKMIKKTTRVIQLATPTTLVEDSEANDPF